MPGLGSRLKASREKLGHTLEQAGEELNIKSEDLRALEEEDFSSLPDKQFALTVLEIYAGFLGLNITKVKEEFNSDWSSDGVIKDFIKKTFVPSNPVSPSSPSRTKSKKPLLIGGTAVIIVLAALLYPVLNSEPVPQDEKKVVAEKEAPQKQDLPKKEDSQNKEDTSQPEQAGKNVPAKEPGSGNSAAAVSETPVQEHNIELQVTTPRGDCWLEVTVDGERVFYNLVQKGSDPLEFNGEKEIKVLFGDAGAADIIYNGKNLGSPGAAGSVLERVFVPGE